MPEDELDRAVDARIDAFRPDSTPPFEAIGARARARKRRRIAAAGTALALALVTGGAVLVVDSSTPGTDLLVAGAAPDTPPLEATPSPHPWSADVHEKYYACLDAKGHKAVRGSDGVWSVELGGDRGLLTFEESKRRFEADSRACDEEAGGGSVPPPAPSNGTTPVTAMFWTGVQLCLVESTEPCRELGAREAAALDQILDGMSAIPDTAWRCLALSPAYRVLFRHPTVKPVPIEVPHLCGSVLRGGSTYMLDKPGRDAVRRAYETGTTRATPSAQAD